MTYSSIFQGQFITWDMQLQCFESNILASSLFLIPSKTGRRLDQYIGLFFYYTKRGQCIGLGGGHYIALRFLYIMAP